MGKRLFTPPDRIALPSFRWPGAHLAALCAAFVLCPAPSQAQNNFYTGKTVTLAVGASAGGGYDDYARAIAPYLSAHIPGKPSVIVRNMPGAGGLASVRYLDSGAQQDGTAIATFNSGVLTSFFANPVQQAEMQGLSWLGSLNRSFRMCYFWHGRGFAKWSDLFGGKTATMGGIGSVNSGAYNDIATLKNLMKANVRAILGYPGRSEVHLAIERGELDGECGSREGMPESWFTDHKIDVVVRMLKEKTPEIADDVPWIGEFLKTPEDLAVLRLLTSAMELGRPYVMSGKVPADRVTILQNAFAAAAKDKEFIELAKKRNLALSLVTGSEAQQLLTSVFATPRAIADRAKEILK